MAKRQLTGREEARIWKSAWNQLRGYHLKRMGEQIIGKAIITRLNIMRPMPDDVIRLVHKGAVIKQCSLTLNLMDSVKRNMWHGRNLASHQSAKLQAEIEALMEEE